MMMTIMMAMNKVMVMVMMPAKLPGVSGCSSWSGSLKARIVWPAMDCFALQCNALRCIGQTLLPNDVSVTILEQKKRNFVPSNARSTLFT